MDEERDNEEESRGEDDEGILAVEKERGEEKATEETFKEFKESE
jgi:hypothetical protein